jgi:hypothetical protein
MSEEDVSFDAEHKRITGGKPRLLVENSSPDRTVAALRDMLAVSGALFERGVPVRAAFDQTQHGMIIQPMSPDGTVLMAHRISRPYAIKVKSDGSVSETNVRLPRQFAAMYLDWRGEWRLPLLNGITTAPSLFEDGRFDSADGYQSDSGLWAENVPDLAGLVPERPTQDQAAAALSIIRSTFKTFCFADSQTIYDTELGVPVINPSKPPGRDESSFLVGLLTAVCRSSLQLAPGLLVRAAPMSGAGAGKGLLARCISIIAFGREPHAVTAGGGLAELDKRIAAELIQGSPVLFLDNLNELTFKSDLLASAITERPARVRLLGQSQMVPLNSSAFVVLTGNGITLSEDLVRRFVVVELDPRTEDPESRPFQNDLRAEVTGKRKELLAALLTIWCWGRQSSDIRPGRPLGSFGQWCRWVRDPLLALGCQDPAARVNETKARDGHRQVIAEVFTSWWQHHQNKPIPASKLHSEILQLLDPQGRGRQYVAARLERLRGTRLSGLVLTRQAPAGQWGSATYALNKTHNEPQHGEHRGDRTPDAPYAPYAGEKVGGVPKIISDVPTPASDPEVLPWVRRI